MLLRFQLLDVDYVLNRNSPVIRLFGLTEQGTAICAFHEGFFPYFYAMADPLVIEDIAKKLREIKEIQHIDLVEKFIPFGYRDQPTLMMKITLFNPQETPVMRERVLREKGVTEVFDADILFKYRFMTDHDLYGLRWIEAEVERTQTKTTKVPAYRVISFKPIEKQENAPIKILSFDIECIMTDPTKPMDAKNDPIIMIAVSFEPTFKEKKSLVLVAKPFTGESIRGYAGEKEMLEEFQNMILSYDPDVITGYNINSFDLPFLLERFRQHGIKPDFTRGDKPIFSSTFGSQMGMRTEFSVLGRVVVDPYQIIKNDPWVKLHRYTLNNVAKTFLGEEKHDVHYKEIPKLWKGTRDELLRLIEYARQDAVLAMRLVTERGLLDKFFELSKISGLLLQDTFGGQTKRVETMMLHEFKKRNFVMRLSPTKEELVKRGKEREKLGLKGATVLEPDKGLHAEGCILVLDFKSLYPSIIRTYNVSPDTVLLEKRMDVLSHQSPTGALFVDESVRRGIFPEILGLLVQTRSDIKKQMKSSSGDIKRVLNAKQLAIKDMSNSFYGYTGYIRARLYMIDVANSITSYGRDNLMKTKSIVEEKFPVNVVYGDSITKDRFVTILHKGFVHIKTAEELFEEHKAAATVIGGKERIRLKGYKALTVDPTTKTPQWSEINEIIRHKTNKKIFRVHQKFGETVVTEDHSLIADDFSEVKPTALAGKSLARVDGIPPLKQIKHLDMFELLRAYQQQILYKKRTKIAAIHADKQHVWFGWEYRQVPVKMKRFIDVESEEFSALCRLMGAYIAEGYSSTFETSVRQGASIASTDQVWLTTLVKDYCHLFENVKTSIIPSTKNIRKIQTTRGSVMYVDRTHKIQMMNSLAAIVFKVLCGQKSSGKTIPNFMFHVPQKYQHLLLDHMIKGDGSRETSPRYSQAYKPNNFRYDTKSLKLACSLSFLLTMLGKKYTIKYRWSKQVYRITTCTNYNKKIETHVTEEPYHGYVYDLSVSGSHMFVDSCGQLLLHNTDSIFLKTKMTDLDESKKLGEDISKFVTGKLPGVLELDFEKIYRTFLILTKKRYAGWKFEVDAKKNEWVDSIDMKGIETVRRDWCLTGDTLIQLSDGSLKPIKDIPDVCKILTINPGTLRMEEDVSIAKAARKSKILKIITDFTEIKATPEHKFFVFSKGKFYFEKCSNLKKGDHLIQAKNIYVERAVPQLIEFEYNKSSKKEITIPQLTTAKLCQIVGFVFGDGAVAERKITLYNQDSLLLKHYNNLFREVFGIGGKLYKGNNCYNMVFFSKKLEMFFRHLGFNNKEKLPDIIPKVPNDQLAAFLRGYFDADGWFSVNHKTASKGKSYLRVDFSAKSKRTAEEVKLLLLRFGITSSNLRYQKSLGEAYEFRLHCENARLFFENIGFTNKKIEFVRPNLLKGKKERLPLLNEAMVLIRKTGYSPTKFFRDTRQATLTKSTAQNILASVEEAIEFDEELLENLILFNKLTGSDITFSKIEAIEDAGEDLVYDIDTINTDTFLANGLLSHNCPLVSEVLNQLLVIMLKEGDIKKSIDLVKEILEKLRANEVELEKLTIIKGITKDPRSYDGVLPHIELAKKLMKRNPQEPPRVGDRIGFVIIRGNQMLSKRAEDPMYAKENNLQIDSDYYMTSQLLPPVERILSSIGVERTELLGHGRQISLGDLLAGSKRTLKHDISLSFEKKNEALHGWEEFVCKKCNKSYAHIPLTGACACGGELAIGYHGSVGSRVLLEG